MLTERIFNTPIYCHYYTRRFCFTDTDRVRVSYIG